MTYTLTYQTKLGELILFDKYLLGLWFKGQKHFGANYDLSLAKKATSQPHLLRKLADYNY